MTHKNEKQLLAIVPARYGSKRIEKKNIRPLSGKPLIFWTIEAALNAKCVDDLVVSTDSNEISDICSDKYPTITIHARPQHLATDEASTVDAVIDVIEKLSAEGKNYKYTMVLQPTSPLRTASDISAAFNKIDEQRANSLISLCETDHPIEWTTKMPKDENLGNFVSSIKSLPRSQDIEKSYRINGAIYISLTSKILSNNSLFDEEKTLPYVMDRVRSIDIDEEIDFRIAEALMQSIPLHQV